MTTVSGGSGGDQERQCSEHRPDHGAVGEVVGVGGVAGDPLGEVVDGLLDRIPASFQPIDVLVKNLAGLILRLHAQVSARGGARHGR